MAARRWPRKQQKRVEGGQICQAGHMANPHAMQPTTGWAPVHAGTRPVTRGVTQPCLSASVSLVLALPPWDTATKRPQNSSTLAAATTCGAAHQGGWGALLVNGLFLWPLQHPETRVLQRLWWAPTGPPTTPSKGNLERRAVGNPFERQTDRRQNMEGRLMRHHKQPYGSPTAGHLAWRDSVRRAPCVVHASA